MVDLIDCFRAQPKTTVRIEGARTQRTPDRGTAKRLSREYAKPRPMGACLAAWSLDFENSRFSIETVAEATQKFIVYSFTFLISFSQVFLIAERGSATMDDATTRTSAEPFAIFINNRQLTRVEQEIYETRLKVRPSVDSEYLVHDFYRTSERLRCSKNRPSREPGAALRFGDRDRCNSLV